MIHIFQNQSLLFKFLICAFFFFAPIHAKAINPADSLLHALSESKSDSVKIDLMNELCNIYIKDGSKNLLASATILNQKAIILAKKISYEYGLAKAIFIKGKLELSTSKILAAATANFLESKKHFEKLNDSSGIAACYMQLGLINNIIKYYEGAISYFSLSLKYNNTQDVQSAVAKYLTAISFSQKKDTLNGKKYFDAALEIYDSLGIKRGQFECYTYMAKMYIEANNLDRADFYFEKLFNSGYVLNEANTLGRIQSIQASYFFKKKNLEKAMNLGLIGYSIGKKFGDELSIIEATNVLYQTFYKLKDYKKAFTYLDEYKKLNDSIYNSTTSLQIAEFMVKAEFDKKAVIEKQDVEKKIAVSKKEIENQKVIRNSILGILIIAIGFLIVVFIQRIRLSKEKNRGEELLLNILPASVAEELKTSSKVHAENYDLVSVMFTDFKDFTKMTSNLSAKDLVTEIDYCFSAFDKIISNYNIEKIKTIGDAYMCASGVPKSNPNHAVDIINAAFEIQKFMNETAAIRKLENKPFFEIRCGIHSGPVVAGVVGTTKFAYDIWGATVNIASRIESVGEEGKINISETTYQLIKNKFSCSYRGKIHAKNLGEIDMYFVEGVIV